MLLLPHCIETEAQMGEATAQGHTEPEFESLVYYLPLTGIIL